MRTCSYLAACLFVGVACAVALAQPENNLSILDTLQVTVADDKKPALKTSFIASEAEWKMVWNKVNPNEKPPAVDFAKHFLLVTLKNQADPNKSGVSVLKDGNGVVRVNEISTLIGFKASMQTIYRFHKVSREGVTGVLRFDPMQKKMVVDPLPK
jgi:hypothetical protein